VALDSGWCKSKEDFEFCYAYAPESRTSLASRRREWRVLSLVAPSLNLDPNAENYPFSVKPDVKVTMPQLVSIFKDYYEGTPFDMTKDMLVPDKNGKMVISPLANPHMPYDANKLFRINGGWGWMGERTIARWYTMYATIIQCRDWLPDPIGGLVWLAMDNVATSVYVPVYCGVTDLPEPYKVDGRIDGFSNQSAWWAFNRLGTLTAQRWGDMRHDVDKVWNPIQAEFFEMQPNVELQAVQMYKQDPGKARAFLTSYTMKWGNYVIDKAWKLGDYLWTKYDELF
jgi:dipeptidase